MNKRCRRSAADSGITGVLIALLLLIPAFASADGMAFHYDTGSSMQPLEVNEQKAFIAHKDGIQRMFIAVNIGDYLSAANPSRAAVWIFPVPGGPDRVRVDVTDFIPDLEGKDVEREFRTLIEDAPWVLMVTQPHLVPLLLAGKMTMGRAAGIRGVHGESGVTTHKSVERWGIHAELITADSIDHVADYLRRKNVETAGEGLKTFAPYLSDKYTLVTAWISSREKLVEKFGRHKTKQGPQWPSLYVECPAKKPFYPMRPTSGYGKKSVQVSLFLLGWLIPDMWSPPEVRKSSGYWDIRYFQGRRAQFDRGYRAFLSGREKERLQAAAGSNTSEEHRKGVDRFLETVPKGDIPFTRVRINAPAENFTEDFRFSPNRRVHVMHFITSSPWVLFLLAILLVAVLSYVSAGISGKALFGAWRPWARIGIWNLLTVAALVVAAWIRRRTSSPGGEAVTAAPRRDALVFGVLGSIPLIILVKSYFLPFPSSLPSLVVQFLMYILISVELFIAVWIVLKPGPAWKTDIRDNGDGNETFIPRHVKESFLRVALMCAPALVATLPFALLCLIGAPIVHFLHIFSIILGPLILLPVVTAIGLFAVSRLAAKRASPSSDKDNLDAQGGTAVSSSRKPEALILGALASAVAVVTVVSVFMAADPPAHGTQLGIACFGSISALLAATSRIVWRGESGSSSMEARVSPWLVALSVVLGLLTVCGIVTYVSAKLLTDGIPFLRLHHVHITGRSLMPAITLLGAVAIVGYINRNHVERFRHGMTYRNALSAIILTLGVLSFLGMFQQFVSAFLTRGTVRDSIAVFALLCGTWLVKGELQEGPTKALRFGVLFSIVFTILIFLFFAGLRPLLAAAGF